MSALARCRSISKDTAFYSVTFQVAIKIIAKALAEKAPTTNHQTTREFPRKNFVNMVKEKKLSGEKFFHN